MFDQLNIDPAAIPPERIPALITQLAALQSALAARLMTPTQEPQIEATDSADVLLKVDEVADRLRKSAKWVYRRAKTLPFARRLGPRSWVFSQNGMERWLARQRV